MILRHLISKLEAHFPGRFSLSDRVVRFPEKHSAVGSVEIHDDAEELTIYAGKFTHVHFSNYDSSLTKEQAAEQIANDALAFFVKLFSDQIVMWGSLRGRGGCYERERGPRSVFSFARGQEYVWSGPVKRHG